MEPVQYDTDGRKNWAFSLLLEIILNSIFCLLFIIFKEVLTLNKLREAWLNVLIVPLYFVVSIDQCEYCLQCRIMLGRLYAIC